jgi:hypothetical protein
MILVICLSNTVDVLFDALYLIIVEDKEVCRDNNGLLVVKERGLQRQGEMLLTMVSLGIANKAVCNHGHILRAVR